MSVTANPLMKLQAVLSAAIEGAGTVEINLREFDRGSSPYSSASTPPVSKVGYDKLTLSGGTDTIDLTAVPNQVEGAQDLTGVKIVCGILKAPSTNTGNVTIAKGASNGYELNGTHSIELKPGETLCFDKVDELTDVAAGAKNLDVSGTASDKLHYILVAG